MSENSLPSTKEREYTVLHIWPALPCLHCQRLTNVLILDPAFTTVEPACPLHGFTSAGDEETLQELALRYESVARFVLWMHCDQGRVTRVSPVADLATIPGYDLEPDALELEEIGFHVAYEDAQEDQQDAYVVWSAIDNSFYLYERGALVSARHEEVA